MSVRMVMISGREVAIEQSQIPTNVRSNDRFVGLHPRSCVAYDANSETSVSVASCSTRPTLLQPAHLSRSSIAQIACRRRLEPASARQLSASQAVREIAQAWVTRLFCLEVNLYVGTRLFPCETLSHF